MLFTTRPRGRVFLFAGLPPEARPDAAAQHLLSTQIPQSFHDFTDLTSRRF